MIEITVQELFERTILQNRPQTFQECVDVLADIMSQNRSACMHLFRSRSRIDLQLYYHRVCGFVVTTFLESVEYLGKFHTPEQKEAIAQYYKCLLLGLMTEWMAGGMRGDVKKSFASMQKAAEVLYR